MEPVIEGQEVVEAPKVEETPEETPQENKVAEELTQKVLENIGLTDEETEDEEDLDFLYDDDEEEVVDDTPSGEEETPEQAEVRRLKAENKRLQAIANHDKVVKSVMRRYPDANSDYIAELAKKGKPISYINHEAKRDNASMKRALKIAGERVEKELKAALANADTYVAAKEQETAAAWGKPDAGNVADKGSVTWDQIKHLPESEQLKYAERLKPRTFTKF